MKFSFRSTIRRLAAVATLPALALGLSLGSAPQAAAEIMGTASIHAEFVVHKNDTVDLTYSSEFSALAPSLYCEEDYIKSTSPSGVTDAKVEIVGNACVVSAKAIPLKELNSGSTTLKHEDGKFIFREETGPGSNFGDDDTMSVDIKVSVTFPGKVQKVSGGGVIKGNKVTWTNPPESGYGAEASDGSFNVLLWVLIGLFVLIAVAALVIVLVVVSKRKKTPPAGPYPQQGMQFQAQPSYAPGQPAGAPYGQPQTYQPPSQPYQQPSQPYQQPGGTPQPPVAGQPYQQPGYGQPQGGQAPGSNGYGY